MKTRKRLNQLKKSNQIIAPKQLNKIKGGKTTMIIVEDGVMF